MKSLYVLRTGRRLIRTSDTARAPRRAPPHRREPIALRDVGEHGRHEPVALLRQAARRLVDLGALLLPATHELLDLLELRARVDRADVGVLVERIADAQGLQPPLQLRDDRFVDRLLHEQPRPGATHVALVEVDPVDDPLDRLVERSEEHTSELQSPYVIS